MWFPLRLDADSQISLYFPIHFDWPVDIFLCARFMAPSKGTRAAVACFAMVYEMLPQAGPRGRGDGDLQPLRGWCRGAIRAAWWAGAIDPQVSAFPCSSRWRFAVDRIRALW